MDEVKRRLLERQRENIIRDLDVTHILDQLYTNGVINENDFQMINSKLTPRDKAICFFDILLNKDNKAYDQFVFSLEKAYKWLSEPLQQVEELNNGSREEREAFEDALVLGDVPRQPAHYVDREEPLQTLRKYLRQLSHNQRIVLHGMTGSGKSCLAAAAIKDEHLLRTYFHHKVFWINLGEVKSPEQLPSHMYLLYQRLSIDMRQPNHKSRPVSMSVVQEGGNTLEYMKDLLKNTFCKEEYRDALLILDNVSLPKATDAFDVGCKVLITTQDKDVVTGAGSKFMAIQCGFTEQESLSLFAKCIETTVEKLPPEAGIIHTLCKGKPMLIALLGSLLQPNKDALLTSSANWKYYIDKLTKKDYGFKIDESNKMFAAISLCIEKLDNRLREFYKWFAVFVEDINITPLVLQTLWNEDVFSVQNIMNDLQNKSLVVSYYNRELKTYVYGIHDLLLFYLKEQLNEQETLKLHIQLIDAYEKISGNNFAKLHDDNYIFQYLGYHLEKAGMTYKFKEIYFDLNFIGAKIKAIGIADLLRDFIIYKDLITNKEEDLVNKLEEYVKFIKAKGQDLHKYKDTDVIQCALCQDKDSSVYKAALEIANKNTSYLYLQLQAAQENIYFMYTLDLTDDVSAACFTTSTKQILVGMNNGCINLWEQEYHQKLCSFTGHTGRVRQLQLSSDGEGFLSVSDDGSVKLWSLDGAICRTSNGNVCDENGFNLNIPSPRMKQTQWQNFFGNDMKIDRSKTIKLPDENDRLISASYSMYNPNLVVTGSQTGRVIAWNTEPEKILVDIPGKNHPATCVSFSYDDCLVIFTCDSNIFLHNAQTGEFLFQFCNKVPIEFLLIVPESNTSVIAINESRITLWTWRQMGVVIAEPCMTNFVSRKDAKYLCGAVTNDGVYLVAGSTDHYIRMWNVATGDVVQEFFNNKGLVICLDTFFEDDANSVHILLSGSDDKTVKQWHIQPMVQTKQVAKLLPIFDIYWSVTMSVPRIAVVNTENRIQIMNGHNLIVESNRSHSPIKQICFSSCGNKVVYGLENGDVMEFDFKNRLYKILMKLHDSIMLLKYFRTNSKAGGQNCDTNGVGMKNSVDSGILVASAQNGWFTVYRDGHALCLIRPQPAEITVNQRVIPVIPNVKCFYLQSIKKLLSISENHTIKLWDLDHGAHTVLAGDKITTSENCGTVTMAALSNDESHLAITMTDNSFEIYCLTFEDCVVTTHFNQGKSFDCPLRCCSFSHNGKLLALGQDNGNVVIWCIELKTVLTTLELHKSLVRHLLFSPSPGLILISVGEQIAWWDLTKVPNDAQNSNIRNFRRRSNSAKKNLQIDLPSAQNILMNWAQWSNKIGRGEKPHLLAAIKLRGLFATQIFASQDFTAFCTVDSNGYLYIMDVLSDAKQY